MKAELQFVTDSSDYFTEFTENCHRDEPWIHLLFAQIRELILVLPWRILSGKSAEAMAKRLDAKLFDDSSNMKILADVVLSYDYLKDVEERHKKSSLMRVHEHFRASASWKDVPNVTLKRRSQILQALSKQHSVPWLHSIRKDYVAAMGEAYSF